MKNKKILTLILILNIVFSFSSKIFAADKSSSTSPEPYDLEEFPQALLDVRRFEIITLGSMPFVMLDTTLVYAAVQYFTGESEVFNFMNSSTYTIEESKNLILISLGISVGIGLTDFIVRLVKRNVATTNQRKMNTNLDIMKTQFDLSEIYGNNLLDETIEENNPETENIENLLIDDEQFLNADTISEE